MNYFDKNIQKAVDSADPHGFCAGTVNQQVLFPSHSGGCDWTLEAVVGCTFKCSYCLAKVCSMAFGELNNLNNWNIVKIKDNIAHCFKEELKKVRKNQFVWVCDLTDPFMSRRQDISKLHLDLISEMNDKEIYARVLTKGYLPKELFNLSNKNKIGVSASVLDDNFRKIYEKNTIPSVNRIKRLKQFHNAGFYTWVSIAPYPSPDLFEPEPIEMLLSNIKWADGIVFDAFGYFGDIKKENKDFYFGVSNKIYDFCQKHDIEFNNASKVREIVKERLGR